MNSEPWSFNQPALRNKSRRNRAVLVWTLAGATALAGALRQRCVLVAVHAVDQRPRAPLARRRVSCHSDCHTQLVVELSRCK